MATVTASPTVVVVDPDSGTVDWNNVSRVLVEDASSATAVGVVPTPGNIVSHGIRATGFDFSAINDSDIINSITLEVVRKADRDFTVGTIAYIVELGVITTTFPGFSAYWTSTLTPESLTKSTSLPFAATLKASTSGVVVVAFYGDGGGDTVTASIDAIRLTVDYTSAAREVVSFSGAAGLRLLLAGVVGLRPLLSGNVGIK